MATILKIGIYNPPYNKDESNYEIADIYVDNEMIQIINDDDQLVVQLTYEELRGIMAIMAAEQEKTHLFIKAQMKGN